MLRLSCNIQINGMNKQFDFIWHITNLVQITNMYKFQRSLTTTESSVYKGL